MDRNFCLVTSALEDGDSMFSETSTSTYKSTWRQNPRIQQQQQQQQEYDNNSRDNLKSQH
jgi:hypothetical protein